MNTPLPSPVSHLPSPTRPIVLVVDDAVENIATLGTALQGECEVLFATRGAQALEMAAAQPGPDLIMLDVVMPEMDGYEVCRRLKASDETRGIPVIFLTSRDEERDEAEGFAAGAVDYIHKPFSTPLVRARVRTQIELKRKTDKLARTALLDGLTGIANRRRFDEAIEREWRRAIRSGQSLALVMIDVDYFKRYNDRYGHMAGDDCLVAVAQALDRTLGRASDLVARLGGEEFVALLPGCDVPNAIQAAQRLQAAVAELQIAHEANEGGVVTLSMGVAARLPSSENSPSELLEAADRALYAAKAGGRNRVSAAEESAPEPMVAPLEAVRRALEYLAAGDLDGYAELYAAEVVYRPAGIEPLRGREALRGYYQGLLGAFSQARVEVHDLMQDGDKIICRFTFHGLHTGPFQGVEPTGRAVAAEGISVLRFASGLCVERWSVNDQLGLLRQVGLLPA